MRLSTLLGLTAIGALVLCAAKPWNSLVLSGHKGAILSAAFSRDGRSFFTIGFDGSARVWNDEGLQLDSFKPPVDDIRFMSFSPDGELALVASKEGSPTLWNHHSHTAVTLKGDANEIRFATFSPNREAVLVVPPKSATADLWNTTTGQRMAKLDGHQDWIVFAAFSPNGAYIVTCSLDNTARLWNAGSGELIAVLPKGRVATDDSDQIERRKKEERKINAEVRRQFGSRKQEEEQPLRPWKGYFGQLDEDLQYRSHAVYFAAFSPDSKQLALATLDSSPAMSHSGIRARRI